MKISKNQAICQDWDKVKSRNYKLKHLSNKYQSVVYAQLNGDHGEVSTKDIERVYFIIEGSGKFIINEKIIQIEAGDIITVPPRTKYDYSPDENSTLKVILFMELWDN